jgi:hypothetical protein
MTTRIIPDKLSGLLKLGKEALAGVINHGVTLGVAQNTAPRITTDHYDLFGEPGENPVNRGKQAALNAKRDAVTVAIGIRRSAIADGRKFCAKAVDLFKGHLGRTWNAAWTAAGFTRFTIAVSKADVATVLVETRNYLRENPGRENVPLGITAVIADTHLTAVEAANVSVNTAKANRGLATAARDGAVRQLKRRLSGLREELDRLLSPDDPRWHEFGFSRPIDGSIPAAVTGLIVTPALPGQVLVQHAPSARAMNYRVSWTPQVSGGEPTEVGLFADLAVALSGLPTRLTIVVSVTARNNAGETQPASVTVVVP